MPPLAITQETVARMAQEIIGLPLKDADRKDVVELLQALAAEMTPLRHLNLLGREPAHVYNPAEAES